MQWYDNLPEGRHIGPGLPFALMSLQSILIGSFFGSPPSYQSGSAPGFRSWPCSHEQRAPGRGTAGSSAENSRVSVQANYGGSQGPQLSQQVPVAGIELAVCDQMLVVAVPPLRLGLIPTEQTIRIGSIKSKNDKSQINNHLNTVHRMQNKRRKGLNRFKQDGS